MSARDGVHVAAGDDESLLEDEREVRRLLAVFKSMPGETVEQERKREPVTRRSMRVERRIKRTPPASLVGVAVKLRLLADHDCGLDELGHPDEVVSLRQCLKVIESMLR